MYKWERINASVSIMKIPSGWLIKINETFAVKAEALRPATIVNGSMSVAYIPDPEHKINFEIPKEAKVIDIKGEK